MKTFFTFSSFAKKTVSFLSVTLYLMLLSQHATAQAITATEDFEDESGASSFSISGGSPTATVNFNHTFTLQTAGTYGYNSSVKYLYIANNGTGSGVSGVISINNSSSPNVSFKINSFAGFVATGGSGAGNTNGTVTVKGTPVGGTSELTAVISINSTGGSADANGVVNGLSFAGTTMDGLYFKSLTFSISNPIRYFEIDHISFTTAVPVTNQFSISDPSVLEGSSGTKSLVFNISCSSTTAASSVQVKSSDVSATTAGSDYVAFPLTSVVFNVGDPTTKTVSVTINGDLTIENDETLNMTLSNPSGGTIGKAVGVGTILDDDNILENFEDETANTTSFSQLGFTFKSNGSLVVYNGNDIGAGSCGCPSTSLGTKLNIASTGNVGSFYITSVGTSFDINSIDVYTSNDKGVSGTTGAVNVTFTGTKADGSGNVSYVASIGAISGHTFKTVNFTGTSLANIQLSSISVTLGPGINYIALDNIRYGTVVTANPGPVLSINDVSILEGTGGGTTNLIFTVTRSVNTSAFSVDVASSNLSATAGSDYTAFSTTLNFTNGGALTQTVSVNITRDAVVETNETFNMTLSGATNGVLYQKQVGLGTILDDDRIIETFEDETNAATTFSENTITFSADNRFKVNYNSQQNNGSSSTIGYLTSGTGTTSGSMGKITVTSPNTAFKLLQLDAFIGSGATPTHVASSVVTFTGYLYGGGTVTAQKTITTTADNGLGWQQNITFTGTQLDNVLLTALEFSAVSPVTTINIDNFVYAAIVTAPYLEVTDASSNKITNNGTASTTNSTDLGASCVGSSITKTYTIKNSGGVNLSFSGSPLAVLGGTNANQFSVTQPTSPVAANGTTTFTVTYTPTTAATHNATITLTSNDASNTPFVINLKGLANAALSVTTPANVTSSACTGNPITFTTTGSGSGTLSYQWYLGSTALNEGSHFVGVTSASLTINNPTTADNASNYNVKLSSTTGCPVATSNNVALTITAPNTPTATGSGNKTISANNTVVTDGSCNIIATIVPSGAVPINASNGNVTATVTVASNVGNYNSKAYVQRHYDITPTTGASTATATITLYFTQAEFTNYNGYTNRISLPTGPTDPNGGKANIRITQYHGTGTAPGNYTGSGVNIDPVDANIVWNATYSRWEVTFDVVGFSGFYLSDATTLLPLTLLSFTGTAQNGTALLQWTTTNEVNTSNIEVLKSTNGVDFVKIAQLPTTGNGNNGTNSYQYKDGLGLSSVYYYQLRMVDKDGNFTTSSIVAVNNGLISNAIIVKATPNPFQSKILLTLDAANEAQLSIELVDINGKKLLTQSKIVTKGSNTIMLNGLDNLSHGTYILHLFNNNINQVIKMIKD